VAKVFTSKIEFKLILLQQNIKIINLFSIVIVNIIHLLLLCRVSIKRVQPIIKKNTKIKLNQPNKNPSRI